MMREPAELAPQEPSTVQEFIEYMIYDGKGCGVELQRWDDCFEATYHESGIGSFSVTGATPLEALERLYEGYKDKSAT